MMLSDASSPLNGHSHTRSFLVEAINAEKKLWTQILSKGMLQTDVQELYRKSRSNYEKIILSDHELAELQDIEYSLWRLHYKCIDEFRNRIQQTSSNPENKSLVMPQNVTTVQHNSDNLVEAFRSFLSEASEFYQELISKIRRSYGLPEELFFKDECFSNSVESTIMHRCQFSCHRCLIYLGDLARYRKLYARPTTEKCNWSIAATHYLNASMIWPDSGNPHNQLAVLATYIGDEFLTLYHCIRSLAVKNPFPDAWDNLNLLFDKNRASNLPSLSTEATFDFNEQSERTIAQTKIQSNDSSSTRNMSKSSDGGSEETSLWPLIVQTISKFYKKSSVDEFSSTFGSTLRELDILLSLNDLRLMTALESYQHMDASRTGPFRALQLVSILIFTIHTLHESPNPQMLKHVEDIQQPVLLQLALVSTFKFMGRVADRCVMTNRISHSPLLPALLVFAEWLPDMVEIMEMYEADEKYTNAIIYFFSAFVDLLNKFDDKGGENETLVSTALWEDHELQGFAPIGPAHTMLKFSTQERCSFDDGYECQNRIHRICLAAMKLVNRSNGSRKWIFYEKEGRRFCTTEPKKLLEVRQSEVKPRSDPNVKELPQQQLKQGMPLHSAPDESEAQIIEGDVSNLEVHGNIPPVEDEEVILFKPITRYNSAPLSILEAASCDTVPASQCLRRGSSSVAKNHYGSEASSSLPNVASSSCNLTLRQKETLTEDLFKCTFPETCIAAGPPSLSAWVLNREILGIAGDKGTNDIGNCASSCSDDVSSAHLSHLSISETRVTQQDIRATSPTSVSQCMYEGNFLISPGHASATTCYSPFPYSAPVPSAPVLPEDATWFHDDSSNYAEFKDSENTKVPNFLGVPQVNSRSNWTGTQDPSIIGPGVADYTYGYKPVAGRTDSTLQLHQYSGNINLDLTSDNIGPNHFYTPTALGKFHDHDISSLGYYDQWRNPLAASSRKCLGVTPLHPGLFPVQGGEEQVRDKLSHGYQRPSPFVYGTAVDLRSEPHLLLQYLKEREWRVQGSPN
ncbi:protein SMG7L [Macadamia integrifolia]|uniref:protein SMG7L n=1 Tax=Macadamia integrifolia TaxID=60698 RepID=UPI001C52F01D|nr:protein SMG7L [Macadamia integrifolia]XP_042520471.1 protein SMG7L [Macadamia integrifolia]XP_042520472.1 protein SMG7L [Macadamia integrifolia]